MPSLPKIMRRLVARPGTPPEVAFLTIIDLVGGVGRALASLAPISEHAPTDLGFATAAVSIAMAVALRLKGPDAPRAWLHANVVVLVVASGVVLSQMMDVGGVMLIGFSYAWLGSYCAIFLEPRAARLHAVLITVVFGAGLLVADLPGSFIAWPVVTGSVWATAVLLAGLNQRLRTQADTDPLTGLLNRHGFQRAAERERAIATRTGHWPTLAVIDLDDFKEVNDRGGHAAGDRLLCELSRAWRGALRPGDLLARYGGDEFVVLFPATSPRDAETVLARLAETHAARWTYGVQAWPPDEPFEAVMADADELLYRQKAARRRVREVEREAIPGPVAARV